MTVGLDGYQKFRLGKGKSQYDKLVGFSLEKSCRGKVVIAGGNHQTREHFLQQTDIERMMGMMVAVIAMVAVMVVVAVTMACEFGLKCETHGIAAVMVMVWHNGMQHDNRTCHRNHYLCHQMSHTFDFTSFMDAIQSE